VIITAGTDDQGDLYILDLWRNQVGVDDVAKQLMCVCKDTTPDVVLIDNDNPSKIFKNYAVDVFRRTGIYAPLMELPTRGQDKQLRAAAFRGFARQGRVKLLRAPWNADLLMEIEGFPDTCRHDDIVDCLSLLGRYMARMSPGGVEKVEALKPILSGITQDERGNLHTTQTLDEIFQDNRNLRMGFRRIQ
jgi:predicted phage terminase large subunit-like protein